MLSGDGAVTSKPNERMWTMEELRQTADTWSLANDAGLYLHLQQSGDNILQKSAHTRRALENLRCVIQDAHVEAQNSMNALDMLSNHKFLENLVAEDTETLSPGGQQNQAEESAKDSKSTPEEMLLLIRQALHLGLTVLNEQYERIDVLQHGTSNRKRKRTNHRLPNGDVSSSEEEDVEENGFASDIDDGSFSSLEGEGVPLPQSVVEPLFQPRDPYERRQLPHLIGSEAFCQDDTLGIGYLGNEEEQIDEEEEDESLEDVYNAPSQGHVDFSDEVSQLSEEESEREPEQTILRDQVHPRVPAPSVLLPSQRPESSVRPNKGVSMFDDNQSSDESDIWEPTRSNMVPVTQQPIPEVSAQQGSSSTTENRISELPVKPQDRVNEELAKRFSTSQPSVLGNEETAGTPVITPPQMRPVSLAPPPKVPPQKYVDSEEESDDDIFAKPLGGVSKPQTSTTLQPKDQPKVVTLQKKDDTDDDEDDWLNTKPNVNKPQSSMSATTLPASASSSSFTTNSRPTTGNAQVKTTLPIQPPKSTLGGGLFSDDEEDDLFSITKKPTAKPPSQVSVPTSLAASSSPNAAAKSTIEPTSRANALLESSSEEDLFDKIVSLKDKPKPSSTTNQVIPQPVIKTNEIPKKVNDPLKTNVPAKPSTAPVVESKKPPTTVKSMWSDEEDDDDLFINLTNKSKNKPQIIEKVSTTKTNVSTPAVVVKASETKSSTAPTETNISQPKVTVTVAPTKPPLSFESSSEEEDLFSISNTKPKSSEVSTNSTVSRPIPTVPPPQSKVLPAVDVLDDIFSKKSTNVPLLSDDKILPVTVTSSSEKSIVEANSDPLAFFKDEEENLDFIFTPAASRQTVAGKIPDVKTGPSKINVPLIEEPSVLDDMKISNTTNTKVVVPSTSTTHTEKERSDSFSSTSSTSITNTLSTAPPPPVGGVMIFPPPIGLTKGLPDRLMPPNAFQKELEKRMQKRSSKMAPESTKSTVSDEEEDFLVRKTKHSPRSTVANPGDNSRSTEGGLDLFFSQPPSEEYSGAKKLESSSSVNLNVAASNSSGAMLNSVLISRVNMQKPTRRRPTNIRQTVSNSGRNSKPIEDPSSNNLAVPSQVNQVNKVKSLPKSDINQDSTVPTKATNIITSLESQPSPGLQSNVILQPSKPSNFASAIDSEEEDLFSTSAIQKANSQMTKPVLDVKPPISSSRTEPPKEEKVVDDIFAIPPRIPSTTFVPPPIFDTIMTKPVLDVEPPISSSRTEPPKEEKVVDDIFAIPPRIPSTTLVPPPIIDTKRISTVDSNVPILYENTKPPPPPLLSTDDEDIFQTKLKNDQSKPPEIQSSSQKPTTKSVLGGINTLDEEDIFADLPPVVSTKKTKKPSGSSVTNVTKKTYKVMPPPLDDIDDIFDVTPKSTLGASSSAVKSASQTPKQQSSSTQKQSTAAPFSASSRKPPPLPVDDDDEDEDFFDPLGARRG